MVGETKRTWHPLVFYSFVVPIFGTSMLFTVLLWSGGILEIALSGVAVLASCEALRRRLKRDLPFRDVGNS